jgi:hypothetical protein
MRPTKKETQLTVQNLNCDCTERNIDFILILILVLILTPYVCLSKNYVQCKWYCTYILVECTATHNTCNLAAETV